MTFPVHLLVVQGWLNAGCLHSGILLHSYMCKDTALEGATL